MDDQNMDIDDENDRVYNVNLVGNKICGLYEKKLNITTPS